MAPEGVTLDFTNREMVKPEIVNQKLSTIDKMEYFAQTMPKISYRKRNIGGKDSAQSEIFKSITLRTLRKNEMPLTPQKCLTATDSTLEGMFSEGAAPDDKSVVPDDKTADPKARLQRCVLSLTQKPQILHLRLKVY